MKHVRLWSLAGAVGLVMSFAAATGTAATAAPQPPRAALKGSLVPAQERQHPAGSVAAGTAVSFDLLLTLRSASAAQAFVKSVSTPGSAGFHHYLTDAQWTARFGPTGAAVASAESWLRSEGFKVGALPKDHLFVPVTGTAAQVEHAFGVTLGYYTVNGHKVRLANGTLSIPSSVAGVVSGAVGVNQAIATTGLAVQASAPAAPAATPAQEPPPPAGFANPQPCSAYWGQKTDTADSGSLYAPFTHPLPYDICGYQPSQMRGAYDLSTRVRTGNDGTGVTIAIVDAYDSPTLLADAQKYFSLNDPAHPLKSSQFLNVQPATVANEGVCGGSGWFAEQSLDVESSHAMAPGANIEFVGAQDCFDNNLLAALTTAVTSGANIVSDSWGDTLGDLLADAATKTAFDDTFLVADGTGVSVLFSTGDAGDNFADFGLSGPDYPASSPFITAVGGTTLEVNKSNQRAAEYGWSTAKQTLCAAATTSCGSATTPAGALAWQAGGGGGTSYTYAEPFYQAGIVPAALALRNVAITGAPARVIPDVSMDGDAQSGFLIGLTQTFSNGVRYGQFKEGGTSLATPLLAGVIADADQAAGVPLGFLNPVLYKASTESKSAFRDVMAPTNPNSAAVIRVDFANTMDASSGYVVSLRAINYAGPETFCDTTGNCATRNVTLTAGPGFDSLTGLGSAGSSLISVLSKF
jgi:subtilase family serine protease